MRNSRTIAINAILFALTIVLTVINSALPIPGVSIAFLMLLPVLVAAQVERLSTAAFTGFVLGLSSLVCAFIFPNVMSPLFYNPLVSVLPRILIGVVSWTVFRYTNVAIDKISRSLAKKKNKPVSQVSEPLKRKGAARFPFISAFSAMMGVITNTGIVLAMMWIFFNNKIVGEMVINAQFFTALLSLNFVIEIAVCAVLVPPIVYAIKIVLKQPLVVNGYDYIKKLRANASIDIITEDGQTEVVTEPNAAETQTVIDNVHDDNDNENDENSSKIDIKSATMPELAVDSLINGDMNR